MIDSKYEKIGYARAKATVCLYLPILLPCAVIWSTFYKLNSICHALSNCSESNNCAA